MGRGLRRVSHALGVRARRALARGSAAAVLAVGLAACTARFVPSKTELELTPAVVPIELARGLPLVPVYVDGVGPFVFLLDTGSGILVLNERVTGPVRRRLTSLSITVEGASGEALDDTALVAIDELAIGAVRFRDVDAGVLDLARIELSLGRPIDGILGFPLFEDCLWTIDYLDELLVIDRGELPPADGRAILEYSLDDRRPVVALRLGPLAIDALLDTGYTGALELPDSWESRVPLAHPPVRGQLSATIGGEHESRLCRASVDLRLGGHRFRRPWFALAGEESPKIGADLLDRLVVTFDPRNRRVRLAHEPLVR